MKEKKIIIPSDDLQQLESSVGTGNIIKIRYNGGNQPGCVREICPISIDRVYLTAYCVYSKSEKTFRLDRLEIIDDKTFAKGKKWGNEFYEKTDNPINSKMGCFIVILLAIIIYLLLR